MKRKEAPLGKCALKVPVKLKIPRDGKAKGEKERSRHHFAPDDEDAFEYENYHRPDLTY
jgi:hypothetical protein